MELHTEPGLERRLAAIAFADVVDYCGQMDRDEERTHQAVAGGIRSIEGEIGRFGGEVLNVAGDGVLMRFSSARDCVAFANTLHDEIMLTKLRGAGQSDLRWRIGINLADAIEEGGQVYGCAVNIAARLADIAEAGQTCVTQSIRQLLNSQADFAFEAIGPQRLKHIGEPVEAYLVRRRPGRSKAAPEAPIGSGSRNCDKLSRRGDAWPWVVVLPFENRSGEASENFLADGFTEDIIHALSRFRALRVIARDSAFVFKGRSTSAHQVANQLGVHYVISGRMRRMTGRIRLCVELADCLSGVVIWSETFDRDAEAIFEIQDEIVELTASAMAIQIETAERRRCKQARTETLAAYGLLLMGQEQIHRTSSAANRRARGFYERALDLQPDYGRAYAMISRTFNYDWRYSWTERSHEPLERSFAMAQRAIALDPGDARSFAEMGYVQLYRKQHAASLAAYERGLGLNPNDPAILAELGDALGHAGQAERAIELIQKAIRLNPFFPDSYLWKLGGAYYALERYEDAIRCILRMNDPSEGRRVLAASYAQIGEHDLAHRQAREILEAHPDFSLDYWRGILPERQPAAVDHFIEGLEKAGLK